MHERETHNLSKYVLGQIVENYQLAVIDQRPMCADTGLPRFYVKMGNEARLEGGMVAMEKAYGVHGGCHSGHSAAAEPGASADTQRF